MQTVESNAKNFREIISPLLRLKRGVILDQGSRALNVSARVNARPEQTFGRDYSVLKPSKVARGPQKRAALKVCIFGRV
jgi:hypothetical protein